MSFSRGNEYISLMHFRLITLFLLFLSSVSCKKEPTGPETDCNALDNYTIGYKAIDAPKVFDVRTNPPTEIINGTLEFDLFYQFWLVRDDQPGEYPYFEYLIDSIRFPNDQSAVVYFWKGSERNYLLHRNDCQLNLEASDDTLHLELTDAGEEINSWRYAIFNHYMPRPNRDTFLFIEFRDGTFKSYEKIIQEFAADYPGEYDTISLERVVNTSKE